MEFISLAYELFLLAIGVYVYLFAIGQVKSKDLNVQQKAAEFRKQNSGWMRILGLALTAIMTVNIVSRFLQWLSE